MVIQAGRTRVLTTMVAEEVQVVTDLVHTATITMMVCCVYIC
jgi:hypothetical protein